MSVLPIDTMSGSTRLEALYSLLSYYTNFAPQISYRCVYNPTSKFNLAKIVGQDSCADDHGIETHMSHNFFVACSYKHSIIFISEEVNDTYLLNTNCSPSMPDRTSKSHTTIMLLFTNNTCCVRLCTGKYLYLINITARKIPLKVISYIIYRNICGFVFLHNFTFLALNVS
jgi:hypothetical protein